MADVGSVTSPNRGNSPVFVVGAARSGTTLLRLMLNEHPDLAIPSESHFLAALFNAFSPTAALSGPSLHRAVDVVIASAEWQRDFAHTDDELRAAVGVEPQSMAELIERIFRLEVGPTPPRWGDKTPGYIHWVRALLECFPDAQVIAIVRDPRDVYLSLRHLNWYGETTYDIGNYLARSGRLLQRWTESCPRDQFRVVRYEDLVCDTERTLRGVCEYLHLPFAGEMQAFFEHTERNVQPWELDVGLHNKLLRPPSGDDVGRWRREGARLHHAEIEAFTVELIDTYGYERRLPAVAVPVLRAEARTRHYVREPAEALTRVRRRTRKLVDGIAARRNGRA